MQGETCCSGGQVGIMLELLLLIHMGQARQSHPGLSMQVVEVGMGDTLLNCCRGSSCFNELCLYALFPTSVNRECNLSPLIVCWQLLLQLDTLLIMLWIR
jgi:hypothetical protein